MNDKYKIEPIEEYNPDNMGFAYIDCVTSLSAFVNLLESNEFSVPLFYEFCNLAEAIVIYDKLISTPASCPCGENASFKSSELGLVTKSLIDENVLSFVSPPRTISADEQPLSIEGRLFQKAMKDYSKAKTNRAIEFAYHLWPLAAHIVNNFQLHPSVYESPKYQTILDIDTNVEMTYSLFQAYSNLSNSLKNEILKYRPSFSIYIPPIPAIVLAKVSKPSELLEELLIQRDKFQNIRTAFKEYNSKIKDESISLEKSMKAQEELFRITNEISQPYSTKDVTTISEWKDLIKLVPNDSDFDVSDIKSITGVLLGKPLKYFSSSLKKRRFLRIYKMRDEYRRIHNLGKLIKNVWSHDLNKNDLYIANQYLNFNPKEDSEKIYFPEKHNDYPWN